MLKYSLAETLHKSVAEVEEMTLEEFNGWVAYFHMRQEDGNG
jgi:hypothetical protein